MLSQHLVRRISLSLSILLIAIIYPSCGGRVLDRAHPDVDLFVRQLKSGDYPVGSSEVLPELPAFTEDDIGALLRYADDLQPIPSFPLSAVSYSAGGRLRLGECILWVVETIRLGQHASMGCKMVHIDAQDYSGIYFLTDDEVMDAVACYRRWWQGRQLTAASPDILRDAPLAGSGYRWW